MSSKSIKTGEEVIVLSGNDKGKRGKVLQVLRKKERVLVEGVNVRKFHEKAKSQDDQGGIREREQAIHLSNVMLATRYDEKQAKKSA